MPSLPEHFLIVPIGMVIQAVVPLPGGMGIGEFTFDKLYEWMNAEGVNGLDGMLVQRMIYWVLGVLGYLVYLRMKPALQSEPVTDGEVAGVETG